MKEKTNQVVVLACSGIGKVYGALARETLYELMERVRPGVVVTTCLPLLMIEDPEAKKLVADHPVITIDGCPKSCSHKNLEAQLLRTFSRGIRKKSAAADVGAAMDGMKKGGRFFED